MPLALCLLTACSAPERTESVPAGPWVTLESEFLDYHARPGDPLLCRSYLDAANAKVRVLLDYLGIDASGRVRGDWYQFGDDEVDGDWYCEVGDACTGGNTGYGRADWFEHELVHMFASAIGHPPPLFTEGLAVSLSCNPADIYFLAEEATDWRSFLHYQAVSEWPTRFVTFLLDEHGVERFTSLYAALDFEASEAEVRVAFERVYEEPIDAAWSRMRADPSRRICAALFHCAEPPLSSDSLGRACTASLARRLPSETATVTTSGLRVLPYFCEPDPSAGSFPLFTNGASLWFAPGGRQMALAHDGVSPIVEASVTPTDNVLQETCDRTAPIPLAGDAYVQQALLAPSEDPLYVEFDASRPVTMIAEEYSPYANGDDEWLVENCAGCENGIGVDCQTGSPTREGRFWLKISRIDPSLTEFLGLRMTAEPSTAQRSRP